MPLSGALPVTSETSMSQPLGPGPHIATSMPLSSRARTSYNLLLDLLFLASIWVAISMEHLPVWVLPAYLALSALSYHTYWRDLRAADLNIARVSEGWMLFLDALGGWPGGLLAQRYLRHKNHKELFCTGFRRAVAFNLVILLLGAWVYHTLG